MAPSAYSNETFICDLLKNKSKKTPRILVTQKKKEKNNNSVKIVPKRNLDRLNINQVTDQREK
jgi:hypothetical protein